jgi:hypothetical protein
MPWNHRNYFLALVLISQLLMNYQYLLGKILVVPDVSALDTQIQDANTLFPPSKILSISVHGVQHMFNSKEFYCMKRNPMQSRTVIMNQYLEWYSAVKLPIECHLVSM